MNKVGIYIIESPTKKIYVGQSRNIRKRFLAYKRMDCKNQPKIYRSLKKHGVDLHKFQVIHHFSSKVTQDVLNKYECDYIDVFKNNGFEMLNIRGGGHNGVVSEETKKVLREKKIGIKRPQYNGKGNPFYGKTHSIESLSIMSECGKKNKLGSKNGRARVILQYDINGNFIKEFDTITNASKELCIFRQSISDCLNNRTKTSGNFIWKYK